MPETTVINCHYSLPYPCPDDLVFIGRPSIWGNPFHLGRDGTRDEVIDAYREWIKTQAQLLAKLHTLRGKRLACFCAPKPCHGDVLAELANALPQS